MATEYLLKAAIGSIIKRFLVNRTAINVTPSAGKPITVSKYLTIRRKGTLNYDNGVANFTSSQNATWKDAP